MVSRGDRMDIAMQRNISDEFDKWKTTGMKKPLMVLGARQVGKSFSIEIFGKKNFDYFHKFDLTKNKEIANIFEKTINPEQIIAEIELRINKKIDVENTLLFFDEVQVSEKFIESLKYFNESEKPYKIICAGSLLGLKINRFNSSFPVGKVKIIKMFPMSFEEFLQACGYGILLEKIRDCYTNNKKMDNDLHEKLLRLYRYYLCIGGMPENVIYFLENNQDILLVDNDILEGIALSYLADMTKYTYNKNESVKIEKTYLSIPLQLAKENTKFMYKVIDEKANKKGYESALDWLKASSMIIECNKVNHIEIPLEVYKDTNAFKIYLSDLGLLTYLSKIDYTDIVLDRSFTYKGALVENYVACEFTNKKNPLYYWQSNGMAEIDYLIYRRDDGIIPIEVKASDNNKSKSLNAYMDKYKPTYAIRVSSKNFGFENNIKSVPLYAVFCI